MVRRVVYMLLLLVVCCSLGQASDRGEVFSGETKLGISIEGPSYLDTWTFAGEAGDRVLIVALTTAGALDTWLDLYPPGGGPKEADGWPWGDVIDHQVEQTGTYTIVMHDTGFDQPGTYNLAFLKIPGAVSSPEDTDGGVIASDQTVSGSSNAVSDVDAFQFFGQAGDRVLITAIATTGALDTWLDLYPPGGGPKEADGWPWGDLIDQQLEQTGVYTVVVHDNGFDQSGSYRLTLLKMPGSVTSEEDPDGGAIASGETASGTIGLASDLDAFQFCGEVGDRVIISAIATAGALDTWTRLYPPGGGPQEADGWPWGDLIDHQLEQTGIYTLVVSDNGFNQTGTYEIGLTKIPSAARPGLYHPIPANGAAVYELTGSFGWDAVEGATGYDLYLGYDPLAPLALVDENLPGPTMPFPPLSRGNVYTWRVVAHRPSGDITGPDWWFSTPLTCSLTVSALGEGSGQVQVGSEMCDLPWTGEFDYGALVTVKAWPGECNIFGGWSGDVSSDETEIILEMDASRAIAVTLHPAAVFLDVDCDYWAARQIASCYYAGIVSGYWDGTYRPEEVVTRDAMAVYISRALAGGDANVPPGPTMATFPDVPTSHWAFKYVEYCYAQSVVTGYWDGYHPQGEVSRAQMAVYIARAMAGGDGNVPEDPDGTPFFPDVPSGYWAYKYVEYCHDQGVVGGYWDGYHPEELVTRAQMAVYVQRGFGLPM